MSDILIEVESGKSKRLLTKDKVCKDDIVVTAKGGGDSGKIGIDDLEDYAYFFASNSRADLYDVIDTSKGKNFTRCFAQCTFTEVPDIDTSNGERFDYILNSCPNLLTVSTLNTSKAKNLSYAFYNSTKITKIENLDLNNSPSVSAILNQCKALTDFYPYNIRTSLQIASGTTWGHLLTVESLFHIYNELCPTTTTLTLTQGSANNEKIAGLYCKIIDNTNEKLPMVLCESADEGAMLIDEYALLKGWVIQ